jgi:putative effector of murein hydrolase LrgA (UPF0299 family)
MGFWIFLLAVMACLSYLGDVGILTFIRDYRIPYLYTSISSVLILFCVVGLLARVLYKVRGREKENLKKKIQELEARLRAQKE